MSAALLDLHIRDKYFGPRRVLENIRLSLAAGEILTLVGKSGCGKSTLLRLIAGLNRRFRGEIRLEGTVLTGIHPQIGLIFQEPRLLPWLTVAENVGFQHLRRDVARTDPKVRQLLQEVGLSDAADALPKALSGGMAQRVAIARGLFRQPRLLLLDEPFSAVDAFTRMHLQDLLLALAAEHGFAVILVTHDIDEAAYLSDRVVVMGEGTLTATIAIALSRPRSRHDPALAQARDRILGVLEEMHAL